MGRDGAPFNYHGFESKTMSESDIITDPRMAIRYKKKKLEQDFYNTLMIGQKYPNEMIQSIEFL